MNDIEPVAAEPAPRDPTAAAPNAVPTPHEPAIETGLVNLGDAVVTAAADAGRSVIETAIETWFHDHFKSLPIGWETTMRNHVRGAVDDLKARLRA